MPKFNPKIWKGYKSKWIIFKESKGLVAKKMTWNPKTKRYIIEKRRAPPRPKPTRKFDVSSINEWQGQRVFTINRKEAITAFWDSDSKSYRIRSRSQIGGEVGRKDTIGIKFTFFAAIGGYPKPGTTVPNFFFSSDILQRKIFRENDSDLKQGIRPSDYGGHIPFHIFQKELNDALSTRDWTQDYTSPNEYEYFQGVAVYTYYRDRKGEIKKRLRRYIDRSTIRTSGTGSKLFQGGLNPDGTPKRPRKRHSIRNK